MSGTRRRKENVRFQLCPVAASIRLMASGQSAPPKLPHIFIAPESVPACSPPISATELHATGITKSLQKLAMPIASIAASGLCIRVEEEEPTGAHEAEASHHAAGPPRR